MNPIKKTFQYGEHTVTLETGEIARQASGAVIVSMGDTVVMVTAAHQKPAPMPDKGGPPNCDTLRLRSNHHRSEPNNPRIRISIRKVNDKLLFNDLILLIVCDCGL